MVNKGTYVRVESYKHNQKLHRAWDQTMVLHVSDSVLIGANDNVKVTEADGREWRTREPAICTFGRGQWFNTIAMIRDDGVHYYCNIGSPFTLRNDVLSYIDYDLDVKIFPDLSYVVLDEEEFAIHSQQMNYPPEVTARVKRAVNEVISWIREKRGAFHPGFVERWYERFLTMQNK